MRLYEQLLAYYKEDFYPMHMPGHKRNTSICDMVDPYRIDITEIEGFDNLHQQEGILQRLSERIGALYRTNKAYPLVNGSTAGILAGISAATNRGDTVLLARNSHKSVYHALLLMGLKPVYIYPPAGEELGINGGISASQIEEALINHKEIRLVILTSPTYEGLVSDIKAIAEVVHQQGALLFIDEAHGAHFGFHKGFPISATSLGADLVVQSLHKTLPSFTQTAVLHSNRKELNRKLENYLAIYQSSSPSYILLAGIDRCISLLEDRGDKLFEDYYERLMGFYQSMKDLKTIKLLDKSRIDKDGIYDIDLSKIIVSLEDTSLGGHELHKLLREKHHIVMEMEAPSYVLGMTSIGDTLEGFDRLKAALLTIDKELADVPKAYKIRPVSPTEPVQIMIPQRAAEQASKHILLNNSKGRITADFICLYPPGIPLLVPGERIEEEHLDYIRFIQREGITITGLTGENKDCVEVLCNEK